MRVAAASRAFLCCWCSLSSLSFRGRFFRAADITAVLLRHSGPVHEFAFLSDVLFHKKEHAFISAWLDRLSSAGHLLLGTNFEPSPAFSTSAELTSAFFTFPELSLLDLAFWQLPMSVPDCFAGFPCLTVLKLHGSDLSESRLQTLESVISLCPQLEELVILRISRSEAEVECAIQAPRLRVLALDCFTGNFGCIFRWRVEKSPLLAKKSSLRLSGFPGLPSRRIEHDPRAVSVSKLHQGAPAE